MTVVVIGGGGFVGRPLVQALRDRGLRVVATSRAAATGEGDTATCDLTDPASVTRMLETCRPDAVVNLATVARGSAEAMVATNVVGTATLLDAVSACVPACHVVLFGSAAEYGDVPPGVERLAESAPCEPRGTYGTTKLAATRLAMATAVRRALRLTIVRPFNVVGAGCPGHLLAGAVIGRMLDAWSAPGPLTLAVGRTDTQRDFIAVDDLVGAVTALVTRGDGSGIVNVCSGQPVPVAHVLDHLAALSGRSVHWRQDPSLVRADEPLVSVGDPAKLSALTGYLPQVPLADALAVTWAHAWTARQTLTGAP